MNIDTLISPDEATEMLTFYERQLASERTAEDEAIMAGYRAAKRGLPVVSLTRVFEAGGFFDNGLPKLAIVRADATNCWCWNSSSFGGLVFGDSERADTRGALVGTHTVRVPLTDVPRVTNHWRRAKTMVPIIPPQFRPRRNRLASRHILWEVEAWEPVPPKDPALMRHIRGDLWAVEACWDLTELERAVLSQRVQ